MNSTSISKVILEVKKLNLVFHPQTYRNDSLRDQFVRATQNPLKFLLKEPERLHVLKNLEFTISQGERVGLLGLNGVGKTSLCRAIAGFYNTGLNIVTVHGKVRAIFDTTMGIYPELTGRENAELLAEFMYAEASDRAELVKEALEFSELGTFLDTPFKNYSNGMQARLCLSLVSARPTDRLILDEVFEGADLFFKQKISQRVLKMIHDSGAVIFVSHDPAQMKEVCNRVLILNQGELIFDGSPEEGHEIYKKMDPQSSGQFQGLSNNSGS
ncbi:MAG: ABC transporter ATP-binding protein [Pseudobdellovibrionaceae bacterium]